MNNGEERKVHLESTIFGCLTGRPSAILKTAYWQALARQWLENCLPKVDGFVSRRVISESEDCGADAVERRKAADSIVDRIHEARQRIEAYFGNAFMRMARFGARELDLPPGFFAPSRNNFQLTPAMA